MDAGFDGGGCIATDVEQPSYLGEGDLEIAVLRCFDEVSGLI